MSKTEMSRNCVWPYKYFLRGKHLINFAFRIRNHQVHSQVFYVIEEIRRVFLHNHGNHQN